MSFRIVIILIRIKFTLQEIDIIWNTVKNLLFVYIEGGDSSQYVCMNSIMINSSGSEKKQREYAL